MVATAGREGSVSHFLVTERARARPSSVQSAIIPHVGERQIEREGRKCKSFEEAERCDVEQRRTLSIDERQRIARALRERVYGADAPDVRQAQTTT